MHRANDCVCVHTVSTIDKTVVILLNLIRSSIVQSFSGSQIEISFHEWNAWMGTTDSSETDGWQMYSVGCHRSRIPIDTKKTTENSSGNTCVPVSVSVFDWIIIFCYVATGHGPCHGGKRLSILRFFGMFRFGFFFCVSFCPVVARTIIISSRNDNEKKSLAIDRWLTPHVHSRCVECRWCQNSDSVTVSLLINNERKRNYDPKCVSRCNANALQENEKLTVLIAATMIRQFVSLLFFAISNTNRLLLLPKKKVFIRHRRMPLVGCRLLLYVCVVWPCVFA